MLSQAMDLLPSLFAWFTIHLNIHMVQHITKTINASWKLYVQTAFHIIRQPAWVHDIQSSLCNILIVIGYITNQYQYLEYSPRAHFPARRFLRSGNSSAGLPADSRCFSLMLQTAHSAVVG